MEKKSLGSFLSNQGKKAKEALEKTREKAVQAMDQNDDGKFDMSDVSSVAEAMGGAMKKGVASMKESAEENRKRMEKRSLQPIFPDDLDDAEFLMPKFIRVADRDKKHAESDVCQGSIGFTSDKGGLRVVNIFKDSLDDFGLSFYPDIDSEFYYVNPADRDNYISLDEYFSYLKVVRVNELQRVAQELGAKHFKVTYKEEKTAYSENKGKVQAKTPVANVDAQRDVSEQKFSMIDVAAEMDLDGHEPRRPELMYLQRDTNIQTLIDMRMNEGTSFHHHKISIKMSNSSGIKESDAVKIDAVLKGMKVSGNATVSNEARNESRRYLEYEIDF